MKFKILILALGIAFTTIVVSLNENSTNIFAASPNIVAYNNKTK